ncbi:MAG: YbjN protein [Caulobacter sp.]|nr:YbjN protein [Caulobacter sp.]
MKRFFLASALVGALLATPAMAQPIPAKGLKLDQMVTWLKDHGYRAEIVTEKGERHIRSGVEGVNFDVYMMDCKGGEVCESMQLLAGFNMKDGITLERANEWNKTKRWAMVSLDNENDPFLSTDISVAPGGSYEALEDALAVWANSVSAMKAFIDW